MKVKIEVPNENIAGILLASDPTSYTLIRLANEVRQAIGEKLGWSAEVESDLEGECRGGRGLGSGFAELLDLTQQWAEKRLKEIEDGENQD